MPFEIRLVGFGAIFRALEKVELRLCSLSSDLSKALLHNVSGMHRQLFILSLPTLGATLWIYFFDTPNGKYDFREYLTYYLKLMESRDGLN